MKDFKKPIRGELGQNRAYIANWIRNRDQELRFD